VPDKGLDFAILKVCSPFFSCWQVTDNDGIRIVSSHHVCVSSTEDEYHVLQRDAVANLEVMTRFLREVDKRCTKISQISSLWIRGVAGNCSAPQMYVPSNITEPSLGVYVTDQV